MVMELLDAVESESLFQYIKKLEGTRHPLIDFDALDRARQYIVKEFEDMGYIVHQQEFHMEGFDRPFYNIEAYRTESDSYFLVTSHYDTVMTTPGAADNASAVAVMLEVAKSIQNHELAKSVKFVCFTLEENNPSHQLKIYQHGRELGLLDENNKPKTLSFFTRHRIFFEKLLENRAKGSKSIFDDTLTEVGVTTNEELEFFNLAYGSYRRLDTDYSLFALIGSSHYANSIKDPEKILGIINYDPIGFTNKKPNSQQILEVMDPKQLPKHHTSEDLSIGDFALIMSEKNSMHFGKAFLEAAKDQHINLASCWIHLPLTYAQIAVTMPDILRSDHSAFWKLGIPGIFVSDTANFRNPNYHRQGDTYDTLDYEFMKQVCQTTIKFLHETLSK